MLPAPGKSIAGNHAGPSRSNWMDLDDDEGWQDMPVVRSDDNPLGLDEDDQKRYHYRPPVRLDSADPTASTSNATGQHLEVEADTLASDSWRQKQNDLDESDYTRIRLEEDEDSEQVHMRTKYLFDEDKAMTPLSQMQATKELLTEGQRIAYVGLCHLIARRMVRDMGRGWEGTKVKQRLLAQARGKGKGKVEVPVVESAGIWMIKIMARLYQHMELEQAEQKMIESLAEHGVDPSDLAPALTATHTVKNPEFDPQAKKKAELGGDEDDDVDDRAKERRRPSAETLPRYEPRDSASLDLEKAAETPLPPSATPTPKPPSPDISTTDQSKTVEKQKRINPFGDDDDDEMGDVFGAAPPQWAGDGILAPRPERNKPMNPFGDDDDEDEILIPPATSNVARSGSISSVASSSRSPPIRPSPLRYASFDDLDDEEGDIGRTFSPSKRSDSGSATPQTPHSALPPQIQSSHSAEPAQQSRESVISEAQGVSSRPLEIAEYAKSQLSEKDGVGEDLKADDDDGLSPDDPDKPGALPSLPGVSTTLTNLDEHVTLDIRWTVLCDLFLVLIADSVYDSRSRAFLQKIAEALGFETLDVVRFENRITDALEIQEAVEKSDQGAVIEGRRKERTKTRYAMMGLAAVGGGLVIGLSAGLLAPVIGAGLGAAFATVGITGTTGFLAGAGGAALITTGGVLTGANIAGQGMARRTREVRTFEFRPLHNNKRVSCYLTMGGFMASKVDDVRLPFSVMDPVVGDVISVVWEPEMMAETGSALKILTSEVLTQVGQQVLAATVMAALMSALQWPLILTKLGYLIDNPWNNALDRARAAGLVLADVLVQRHAGVRPISLIGFSLGARAIFYALVELARLKAYGIVQDVFLFGTTVTASRVTWLEARSVVAGRFVNGFAANDWMLAYLFRATSGGVNTVAGLRPVEMVPGMENVDVTDIITGHMSYRSMMPQLLQRVGFVVTADHFDEPDDPEIDMNVQERTIVTEEEEEAKKNRKKILGLFPRSASKSKQGSGSSTPTSAAGTPAVRKSTDQRPLPPGYKASAEEYDVGDEDDLPPREEADIGNMLAGMESKDSLVKAEAEAVKSIPKTAGFDFGAISKELGKDINPDEIKLPPDSGYVLPAPNGVRSPVDRTGSAPPPSVKVLPPSDSPEDTVSPTMGRSSSYDFTSRQRESAIRSASRNIEEEDDQIGDIATTALQEMSISDKVSPSWDRPALTSTSLFNGNAPEPSPPIPLSSPGISPPSFGYNAWSQPPATSPAASYTSSSAIPHLPVRAAPPARPHPAELMANPFASNGFSSSGADDKKSGPGSGLWGWGKKQKSLEEEATQNPW